MGQDKPRLYIEKDGAFGFLIIENLSRLNSLTTAMWAGLPALIKEAEADPQIKVILVRGSGHEAFSAGADISEFATNRTGNNVKEYDALNHAAFDALFQASKPTIALIEGFCFGGGLGLAISCDLRLAHENSVFSIPAARLGLGYPPHMVQTLLTVVSNSQAKDILFTARRVKAQEALEIGLVNKIYSQSKFEEETLRLATMIAENAPLTIRAAKAAINEFSLKPENPNLQKLDAFVSDCFTSKDYSEGRQAFSEKRRPQFIGR